MRRCEKMSDVRGCEKISHVRRSFICRSIYTSFFLKNPSLRRSREQKQISKTLSHNSKTIPPPPTDPTTLVGRRLLRSPRPCDADAAGAGRPSTAPLPGGWEAPPFGLGKTIYLVLLKVIFYFWPY